MLLNRNVLKIVGTDLLFWLPRVPSLLNGELYARAAPLWAKYTHTHLKSTQNPAVKLFMSGHKIAMNFCKTGEKK